MLVRHAGWQFRLLVITADYCVDGDSRSETSIHLDVYCRHASDYVFSVSDFWIFGRQFVWQVRGVGSFKPTPLEFGRVHCRGSQVSRSSTFNIIIPATLRTFAVLTCPDGPEKAEPRVTSTSQFTSDKNPEAGLYVSSLEFIAGGLSVSGGVLPAKNFFFFVFFF